MPPPGSDFDPPASDAGAQTPDAATRLDSIEPMQSMVDGAASGETSAQTRVEANPTRGLAALAGWVAAVIALAVVYFLIR